MTSSKQADTIRQAATEKRGGGYCFSQLVVILWMRSFRKREDVVENYRKYLPKTDSSNAECSALGTLLTRKKYEANYNIVPNISYCKKLQEVYRKICDTMTHTGPRVCVIPSVIDSESKKVDKLMLFTIDLSEALLEDLMRNELSKMFTHNMVGGKISHGFYQKTQILRKSMRELQKEHYHPARVIETATARKHIFDCFVIVVLTGNRLPYREINHAIQQYRRMVYHKAKLIIVGVDHLKPSSEISINNLCLMVSGVNTKTDSNLLDNPVSLRIHAWQSFSKELENELKPIETFVLELDDAIKASDRVLILQKHAFPIFLLWVNRALFSCGLILSDGRIISQHMLQILYGNELSEEIQQLTMIIMNRGFTEEDIIVLILFVFYQSSNLQNGAMIENIQNQYISMYRKYRPAKLQPLIDTVDHVNQISEFNNHDCQLIFHNFQMRNTKKSSISCRNTTNSSIVKAFFMIFSFPMSNSQWNSVYSKYGKIYSLII
uniref:VWFA domain-containing protein n=1 Tax=Caenorhabditis tropicalis TaxID=1561998 RepID=A0A1I7T2M8_9PELO